MSMITPTDKLIRKLRKKLRQIERLEFLGRSSLNDEELLKVKQKNDTRAKLAKLLKQTENCGIDLGLEPEIDDKIERNSNTLPALKSLKSGSSSIIKPGKLFQNETGKTSIAVIHPPVLEESKDNAVKAVKENLNTPNTVLINSISTEIMKRPSSTEEESLNSQPSSSNTQNKKSKPETIKGSPEKELDQNKSGMTKANKEVPKPKTNNKGSPAAKGWHETPFLLNILEAHNDIVTCVDFDEDYIISGSRDTLVQVWCAKTGSSLNNLRGHTNTVTCALLLTAEESRNLSASLSGTTSEETGPRLALTGSSDCCLKLWNIDNGTALCSIYTFSGVTALCYLPTQQYCVIGSEGGKLEIYTFIEENTNPLFSLKTFDSLVSSIKLQGENLICSSLDGFISVWTLKGTELCRLYQSEDVFSETGGVIYLRPILSLAVSQTEPSVFYGDEGANVKVLTWKTGLVKKLRNHAHDFGITNAICATKSFLLSSSINIDTGNSSINVRSLPDHNYLGTLNISNAGCIVSLAATEGKNDKSLRIVIGGTKLLLLETRGIGCRRSPTKDSVLKPQLMSALALPIVDSEGESSSSEDEVDDGDNDEISHSDETANEDLESPQKSSWCIIL